MGFRPGFTQLQQPQGPSFMDSAAKYRGLQDMAQQRQTQDQQRQEQIRMKELALRSVDPATGRVDEDAFLTALTAEFPLRAREIGQQKIASAAKIMQDNAVMKKNLAEANFKTQQATTEKENRLTELKARDFLKKDPKLKNLMENAHKDIEAYNQFSSYLLQSPYGNTKAADKVLTRIKTKGTNLIEALMHQQNAALEKYERQEEIKREQAQKARAGAIPGYEAIPGIEIPAANVKEASQALTRTTVIKDLLGGLIDKYTKEGIKVIPGESQAEMESTVTDIQMELKELNNLGVLAGPDMGLLLAQLPDPTGINSALKSVAGKTLGQGDPIISKFKTFQKNLDRKLKSKMSTYGYRKVGEQGGGDDERGGLSAEEYSEYQRLKAKYPNVGQ